MRKLALALVLAALAAGASIGRAGDGLNLDDLPPLPPPLLDASPAATPPPLAPPESGAMSPLIQPAAATPLPPALPVTIVPTAVVPAATPLAPPPPPAVAPAATLAPGPGTGTAQIGTPLAPPAMPALAPPPPPVTVTGAGTGVTPPLFSNPAAGATPALPPPAVAELAPAPAAAPVPAAPEIPRTAKISGGRVNVRAGPNTQYESVAVLTTGAPVTVLARNGEWFKIVFPADQLASIHKNYVDADIAGEIPEAGLPGTVNADNADVHAFYWDKSTVVGQMAKGEPVTIRQERGNWYRIAAPAAARAYVFAEYVRVDGGEAVAVDSAPPPVNPAVDLTQGRQDATGRPKLSENDRRAAELKEAHFKRVQDQFRQAEEAAEQQVSRLEEALNELDAKLQAIDHEVGSQLGYSVNATSIGSAAWAPPDPAYGGYTGWVENIGRLGGAPANYRLTKAGEIRFYLRSMNPALDLNGYVGRRVWLNGTLEHAAGAVAGVLNVNQVRILTDLEIAESMRQAQEAGAVAAVGQAPYAQQGGYAPTVPVADGTAQSPAAGVVVSSGDPFAGLYAGTVYGQSADGEIVVVQPAAGAAMPGAPGTQAAFQPTPVVPADPSQLPDVVGAGFSPGPGSGPVTTGLPVAPGEVESDFYEAPAISEIGP